jgi:hypothetical protein
LETAQRLKQAGQVASTRQCPLILIAKLSSPTLQYLAVERLGLVQLTSSLQELRETVGTLQSVQVSLTQALRPTLMCFCEQLSGFLHIAKVQQQVCQVVVSG